MARKKYSKDLTFRNYIDWARDVLEEVAKYEMKIPKEATFEEKYKELITPFVECGSDSNWGVIEASISIDDTAWVLLKNRMTFSPTKIVSVMRCLGKAGLCKWNDEFRKKYGYYREDDKIIDNRLYLPNRHYLGPPFALSSVIYANFSHGWGGIHIGFGIKGMRELVFFPIVRVWLDDTEGWEGDKYKKDRVVRFDIVYHELAEYITGEISKIKANTKVSEIMDMIVDYYYKEAKEKVFAEEALLPEETLRKLLDDVFRIGWEMSEDVLKYLEKCLPLYKLYP